MNILILVDEHGNEIVRRTLKDIEQYTDVFKEESEKYFKSLENGN